MVRDRLQILQTRGMEFQNSDERKDFGFVVMKANGQPGFFRYANMCMIATILILFISGSYAQSGAEFIVIDQFGYPPDAKKVAVVRDPQTGFDADRSYSPGTTFSVIEVSSGDPVYTNVVGRWNNGATDASSGDRAWHFDFSSLTATGTYYILDVEKGMRSYEFQISPNVYNEVLKHAVRSFYYQRVGYAKEETYAGVEWADGASHIGNLQDLNCRSFFAQNDASTERDVSGGWYDAGDYNKYTSWTASYVVDFMKAYLENPGAWADDYNIPESGNGVPDLLDEAKWGIDHLMRLQLDNGSVLSIVGEAHGSPPSSATGASYYGKVNTSGTMNTATALALSSKVYRLIGQEAYADTLLARALKAYTWANENPAVLFNNNDGAYNSVGLGAGKMEVDDYSRQMIKLEAAAYLFDVTGETQYRDTFDAIYEQAHMMQWSYVYPYEIENQEALLYYTSIEGATPSVKDAIKSVYRNSMLNSGDNMPAMNSVKDPYFAFLGSYTWGSNRTKSSMGTMYSDLIFYNINPASNEKARDASLRYLNYIHGVNPLSFVYLSNMYKYGGDHGVNEFYHSWFSNGSPVWDRVGTSTYGPAPGYLTGGANPSYDSDGCCPGGCGSSTNNNICTSESISPPKGQPDQKSYKDFNTSWPLNSWSVTENSCGYQIMYIRLLSNFVKAGMDCNGDVGGSAFMDSCGVCAGGNTGIIPILDPEECMNKVDCSGDLGGVAFLDSCEICSGGETGRIPVLDKEECNDCNGDYNGTAVIDVCGNCSGGQTGIIPKENIEDCSDCNGDFNGMAFIDSCGICAEGNTDRTAVLSKAECYDCNQEFNGQAFIDTCGVCRGGSTGEEPVLSESECLDCNLEFNGSALIDSCGTCSGGTTGLVPVLDPNECGGSAVKQEVGKVFSCFPNPATGMLIIKNEGTSAYELRIIDLSGAIVFHKTIVGDFEIETTGFAPGYYQIMLFQAGQVHREKLIII